MYSVIAHKSVVDAAVFSEKAFSVLIHLKLWLKLMLGKRGAIGLFAVGKGLEGLSYSAHLGKA